MGQYLYNYILIMFKQIVLSCLVASAVSLPQFGSFGPGIRSGPLTPVYGDLFQTPRGLVPLSLEGFSEDVDQDGFVDPVVQTDLPAPAPVALPVNFGTPIPAAFPVSAFPGVPVAAQQVAADNVAIENTGFAPNLVAHQNAPLGFGAQQLRPRGFATPQVAPASFATQQVAPAAFAVEQGVNSQGFQTSFAAPVTA